jgi:hypothetical protein
MSKCLICGREYTYIKKAGHTKTKCNSCSVNQRRFSIKTKALEYKGGKCILCGYNKCNRAMMFHHPNNNKEFGIGGAHARSWEAIQRELDKCVLLCSNCHSEVHAGLVKL